MKYQGQPTSLPWHRGRPSGTGFSLDPRMGGRGMERAFDEGDPDDDEYEIDQVSFVSPDDPGRAWRPREMHGGALALPAPVDEYVSRHPIRTIGIVGAGATAVGFLIGKLIR